MAHLTIAPQAPFPSKIFNNECFIPKPISSPKSKTTTMSFSLSSQVTIKKEPNKDDYATSSPKLLHLSQNKSFDTELKLGESDSTSHPPLPSIITDAQSKTSTSWKQHRERDVPIKDITLQPLLCKAPIDKEETSDTSKPISIDVHLKSSITALHNDAQLYFSQVNNNQYVHKNSHLLLSGSFSSSPRTQSPKRESPPRIHEPLPNIWSKVPNIPPKQDKQHSPDQFRPHAELLLHLRKSTPTSISPLSPTPQSPTPQQPAQTPPSRPLPSQLPLRTSSAIPPPPPPPPTTTHTSQPLTPIPHHRPRRANDYTGEFKREFCALLSKHADARAQWEHFWRRRECTGRRPCIKSYLAFCDLFAEFTKLRRTHKYRVLGTRTNCECSYPAHAQTSANRFTPY